METISQVSGNNPTTTGKTNSSAKIAFNIFSGQLIAVIGVIIGLSASKLQNELSIDVPFFMMSFYFLLFFLLNILISRSLPAFNIAFICIAIVDSQANFLNLYAFNLIHFKYPFLINIISLVWTLPLTLLILKQNRFALLHYIAILFCLAGVACSLVGAIINGDFAINPDDSYIAGLIVCLCSAFCYALSAVLQEKYFEKQADIYEYYIWGSCTGFILCSVEGAAFGELARVCSLSFTFESGTAIISVLLNSLRYFFGFLQFGLPVLHKKVFG